MVLCCSVLNYIVLLSLSVTVGKLLSSHSDIDGLPVNPLLSKVKGKFIYIKEVLKSVIMFREVIRANRGNVQSAKVYEGHRIPQIVPKLLFTISLIKLSEHFQSKKAMHSTASKTRVPCRK